VGCYKIVFYLVLIVLNNAIFLSVTSKLKIFAVDFFYRYSL